MHKVLMRSCLLAVVATGLNGCALLGIGKSEPRIQAMSTIPQDDQAFHQFEVGRLALDRGNFAEAIAAFSSARVEPSLLGPSLNGMGVAYAQLGREDLAERYFREAVRAAPTDERFAANLLRLQSRASRDQQVDVQLAAAQPTGVVTSSGQIHLQTLGAGPRLAAVAATHAPLRIDAGQVQLTTVVTEPVQNGAQVRLRFASSDELSDRTRADYPVRVSFADERTGFDRAAAVSSAGGYPVRVQLAE
ncbi:tetratricopeptide repeat protein [Aurantiacibacter sp. MUD11]|uniref:tetratricopeptide repeat protein n=1 Tax=Aurantiacibacter sp. MUD11 TaxID=3003265 RepID=UPI0022AA32C1|nr:tetratricopeptide repeat protein [Aurantiacibacter sp. MUD11]WAT16704.1 tetratricopeptide repeat protein [Aurantiacibacter sp. MUD11]